MTVADLLTQHCCTAACVAASTGPARCKCPCAGEFHGLLSTADITSLVESRRHGRSRRADLEIVQEAG